MSNADIPADATPSDTREGFTAPLTLHMGEDYAVALLPNETTDTAAIFFGDHTDDAFCERVVRACNAHDALLARVLRLERALREIQLDAAGILDPENKPGYELREYAEQMHAMAASALSSGDPIRNERAISKATTP